MVGAIEARDRLGATRRADADGRPSASAVPLGGPDPPPPTAAAIGGTTPQEAQLRAMLENARKSTWRENLENAADAHGRFMLPGRQGGGRGKSGDGGTPEYVRRIEERSEEILRREDDERRRKAEDERHGRTETRFWR